MNPIRQLLDRLSHAWGLSIRRQLVWSFSLVSLTIILGTGYLLLSYQRHFLYAQGTNSALDLAQTLSFSSTSWVLANDVAGLQEVLKGAAEATDIKFAVVISPRGEVMASTKPEYIDLVFSDVTSQRLLRLQAKPQVLIDESNLIDVAVPIKADNRLIGWVRAEFSRDTANANLRGTTAAGLGIVVFLVLMICIIATRLARRLTLGLDRLARVAYDAEHGQVFQREDIERTDEIGMLARHLYQMLDTIKVEKKAKFESEARFRRVVQDVPVPLCYVSSDGVIAYFNDRFAQVFGYTHDDIPTLAEWWLLAYPDDNYRQWVLATWNAAVQAATDARQDIRPIEYRVTCKNGDVRIMEISGVTLGYDFLSVFIDLTARKEAEDELKRYKDHLEEEVQQRTADLVLARDAAEAANRAKSVFLASMSHELRTPLNAILGFSNMLRKDPDLSQEQCENLNIINRSGEHLLTLINNVLEMAKIEAGRVQLESAPLDLGGLVRDVTDMMQVRAKEKGLQLLIDQSSEFPRYIKGDEARLRQVLINLVGNAVKFTQQGGITVRFGMKPHATQLRLLIQVEDSGRGIKPEDQQRIFEPFVQLGQTGAQKGTGLGLTITKQFVELMGGTISVESTPDVGSTFRVELPVDKADAADVIKPRSAGNAEIVSLAPNQPEYRILIVEDQLENQLLLTKLMSNVGFPVKVADNGEQALELFQSWRPHLIWMDRRMPVMDGLEATRRIRELPDGKEVKIVAVTASAFTEQRTEMLDVGMDDFVRKPYRFNEIYECMTKLLGVQYISTDGPATEDVHDDALTKEMLTVLPTTLRHELHDALQSLDSGRIAAVIQQVALYDSMLHKLLSRMTENFDYPTILNALQLN